MKRIATTLTSILVALALTGTAVGTLSDLELPTTTVPTGGLAGQAVGCELSGDGFVFGYGKNGVPQSSGSGDGECEYESSEEHNGDVTHSVLKVTGSGYGYTATYGVDQTTWDYVQNYIFCNEPATLLVDWTGDEPDVLYLDGADCTVDLFGTLNISDVDWYAYGGGFDDVTFVHTDNLVDALLHLLL